MTENILLDKRHVLIFTDIDPSNQTEFEYIKEYFCGIVCEPDIDCEPDADLYLCGDVSKILSKISISSKNVVYVVRKLSFNYGSENDSSGFENDSSGFEQRLIGLGEVPINIHNVGLYFREFFDSDKDYFNLISTEHQFQRLTESNKPGKAFRKGIYLSEVTESDDQTNFNLLRCSTNLDGPTENFRPTDHEIIDRVNTIAEKFFERPVKLNHVLAQIYENTVDTKERKAKIKEHSDKTKDMPIEALMAFCTFYKEYPKDSKTDSSGSKTNSGFKKSGFDYCYKETSALTRIRFRLKKMVDDPSLEKKFDITLYPNSVLIIPLSTNRLYTHEIIPSVLPIDKIPIRMGYVIRCSNTRAVFKDGQTYLDDGTLTKLEKPDQNGVEELKKLYYKENTTDEVVEYGKTVFSLNEGDYTKPHF